VVLGVKEFSGLHDGLKITEKDQSKKRRLFRATE